MMKASQTTTSKGQLTRLFIGGYCAAGLLGALSGPLLPTISASASLPVATSTFLVVTLFNAGSVAGGAIGGSFIYDTKITTMKSAAKLSGALMLAIAAMNVGIALLASTMWNVEKSGSSLLQLCLIGTFSGIHGICNGIFRTGANWALLALHGDSVGPFLQSLHFGSGVGRFLSGIVAGFSLRATEGGFRLAYFLSCAGLLPLCFGFFSIAVSTDESEAASRRKGRRRGSSEDGKVPGFFATAPPDLAFISLSALFVFLSMGVQNSFQSLLTSYAHAHSPPLSFSGEHAAMLSAAFSGSFAFGRLVAIPLSSRCSSTAMLQASLAGMLAACLFATVWSSSDAVLWAVAASAGLSMASIFPTSMSYAKEILRDRLSAPLLSLLMLSGNAGGVAIPQMLTSFGFLDKDGQGADAMMRSLFAVSLATAGALAAARRCESAASEQKEK